MVRRVMSVRERLWLLAHDDEHEVRSYVDIRALGIGLVAATLTDLMLDKLIEIRDGYLCSLDTDDDPVGDSVASGILTAVREDGASRLGEVLRGARADTSGTSYNPYLRVYGRTRAGLVAAGVLVEQRRTLRSTQYWLTGRDTIAWQRSMFNTRLVRHRSKADLHTDCLCALVWAMNIHRALVMPYSTGEADAILREITERMPARAGPKHPLAAVPDLAYSVRRAVGDLATATF